MEDDLAPSSSLGLRSRYSPSVRRNILVIPLPPHRTILVLRTWFRTRLPTDSLGLTGWESPKWRVAWRRQRPLLYTKILQRKTGDIPDVIEPHSSELLG